VKTPTGGPGEKRISRFRFAPGGPGRFKPPRSRRGGARLGKKTGFRPAPRPHVAGGGRGEAGFRATVFWRPGTYQARPAGRPQGSGTGRQHPRRDPRGISGGRPPPGPFPADHFGSKGQGGGAGWGGGGGGRRLVGLGCRRGPLLGRFPGRGNRKQTSKWAPPQTRGARGGEGSHPFLGSGGTANPQGSSKGGHFSGGQSQVMSLPGKGDSGGGAGYQPPRGLARRGGAGAAAIARRGETASIRGQRRQPKGQLRPHHSSAGRAEGSQRWFQRGGGSRGRGPRAFACRLGGPGGNSWFWGLFVSSAGGAFPGGGHGKPNDTLFLVLRETFKFRFFMQISQTHPNFPPSLIPAGKGAHADSTRAKAGFTIAKGEHLDSRGPSEGRGPRRRGSGTVDLRWVEGLVERLRTARGFSTTKTLSKASRKLPIVYLGHLFRARAPARPVQCRARTGYSLSETGAVMSGRNGGTQSGGKMTPGGFFLGSVKKHVADLVGGRGEVGGLTGVGDLVKIHRRCQKDAAVPTGPQRARGFFQIQATNVWGPDPVS